MTAGISHGQVLASGRVVFHIHRQCGGLVVDDDRTICLGKVVDGADRARQLRHVNGASRPLSKRRSSDPEGLEALDAGEGRGRGRGRNQVLHDDRIREASE